MARLVKDWTPEPVDAAAVAPHRHRWDADEPTPAPTAPDGKPLDEYRAWLATVPYTPGDVVYVAHNGQPVLARVLRVFAERDNHGDRRAKYRVQLATKAGLWSRAWVYTYPGPVQRGYALAGLAPEMPARERH